MILVKSAIRCIKLHFHISFPVDLMLLDVCSDDSCLKDPDTWQDDLLGLHAEPLAISYGLRVVLVIGSAK